MDSTNGPSVTSLRAFTTREGTWRLAAKPNEVAPIYLKMLVAYEDRRFHLHPGVDPIALARAGTQWLGERRIVSGGSTITMQVARLLDRHPRSLGAKLGEMAKALSLERRLSKEQVLSLYLTLAPFGGNLEGVRSASLAYFGKEPGRLSAAECALLVVLPRSPERLRPDRHPDAARAARDRVLLRMADAGVISPADLSLLRFAEDAEEAWQELASSIGAPVIDAPEL